MDLSHGPLGYIRSFAALQRCECGRPARLLALPAARGSVVAVGLADMEVLIISRLKLCCKAGCLPPKMSVCAATRHDWRFAAFIHFCRLFADALHLITFSADRLEAAIVEPAEHPLFLTQLLTSLLNAKAEWQHALWYKLRRQWREHLHVLYTGNPLEHKTFFELSPSERVRQLPIDSLCAGPTCTLLCHSGC